MDETDLRAMRGDVEANLPLPDFERVVARGRQIRRRRTTAVAVGGALAVVALILGVTRPFDTDQALPPAQTPDPIVESEASRVLRAADAYVDADLSRVNTAGDMLAVVSVSAGTSGGCPSAALRWTGASGGERVLPAQGRLVEAAGDGFVVGAAARACTPDDRAPYLVDGDGRPRTLTWGDGPAESVCSPQPDDPRCRFDLDTGRGSLVSTPAAPTGSEALPGSAGDAGWATSADGRTVHRWDGERWVSHTASLPADQIVTASAAGDRAVVGASTQVEVTDDGGRTWTSRDLTEALRPITVADVDWTVTSSGTLLGVTQLAGRGDLLFRSTDGGWSDFEEVDLATAFGQLRPMVEGDAVYVVDEERWAVSTDDGATWRRTPALP